MRHVYIEPELFLFPKFSCFYVFFVYNNLRGFCDVTRVHNRDDIETCRPRKREGDKKRQKMGKQSRIEQQTVFIRPQIRHKQFQRRIANKLLVGEIVLAIVNKVSLYHRQVMCDSSSCGVVAFFRGHFSSVSSVVNLLAPNKAHNCSKPIYFYI